MQSFEILCQFLNTTFIIKSSSFWHLFFYFIYDSKSSACLSQTTFLLYTDAANLDLFVHNKIRNIALYRCLSNIEFTTYFPLSPFEQLLDCCQTGVFSLIFEMLVGFCHVSFWDSCSSVLLMLFFVNYALTFILEIFARLVIWYQLFCFQLNSEGNII